MEEQRRFRKTQIQQPSHFEAGNTALDTDIVEVIARYVQMERSGRVFRGRCPFHTSDGKGRQQTLVVWPDAQTFNCFKPECKANVKSRKLGRRQGVRDFLELIKELSISPLPTGPSQIVPHDESRLRLADSVEPLALPLVKSGHVISRISYSMLESYQLCPLRFKSTYVEHRSTETTTFSRRLGLSIHSTLRKFFGLPVQDRTLSKLHQLLNENWQRLLRGSIEDDVYWHSKAHEMLEVLYQSEGSSAKPVALESSFTLPVESFLLVGRIDRIDKLSAGQYEVIDYKVLRDDLVDEKQAMDSLQSVCLYFGANSLLGVYPSRITYLHVDTGERTSFIPTHTAMEEGLSKIKELVKEIREATDFPATRNAYCSACHLYGRCPATQLSSL